MSDHGSDSSSGRFSWLRDLLKGRRERPELLVGRDRDPDRATKRVQIDIIRRAFAEEIGVATGRSRDDADAEFLFHPERILMLSEHVEEVHRYFGEHQDRYDGVGDSLGEPIVGLSLYLLPPRRRGDRIDVLATLDDMDRAPELRAGMATPDHILHVVPQLGKLCPATEPELPTSTAPVPGLSRIPDAGKDIRVSVVDTGWYPGAATDSDSPWLTQGVDGDLESLGKSGTLGPYAGHGTFVAGVIRCLAPHSTVEIEGVLQKGGAVYESDIARELNEAMRAEPHLISISAGTHTRNGLPLLGFVVLAHLYQLVDGEDAPLVVAAAGNDGNDAPFWPAAFDWVVGVGALDLEGNVTDFSNHGSWVDVYAHGDKLVNAFPSGTFTYVEPTSPLHNQTVTFTGLAQWSGTSFATPVVTGAIAAYMSENDVKARQARDDLIDHAPKPASATLGRPITQLGPPFM